MSKRSKANAGPRERPPGEAWRRQEEEMRRVHRALRTLSSCNQAVIQATEENALLAEVCRVAVEDGGYVMAWVGYAESDARRTVRPVARSGNEAGYLDTADITWADEPRGRGPTGTAIRTRRPAVCRDMHTDPQFAPWREEAVRRGYAASIVLPLLDGERVLGAISIYAAEPSSFDPEEVTLLEELAGDLVFGIRSLRTRRAHQQATAQLEQALTYNRSLIEAALDPLVAIGADGRITDVNAATEQATGCTRVELIGTDFSDYFTDPGGAREGLTQAFRAGLVRDLPLELRHRGGQVKAVLFNASVYRDGRGEVLGVFAAARDMTERQSAEREMRRRELELKAAQRIAHVGSWQLHLPTGRVTWTEELYGMFGLDPAQPPPDFKEHHRLFTPESWQRLGPAVARTRESGEPYELELEAVRVDGSKAWMLARGEAQRDAAGRIIALHGVAQDITARVQAEAALRASEAQLSTAVRMARLGAWEYDVATDTFTFNDPFYAMLRTTAEREGGYRMASRRYAERFVHPEDIAVVAEETRAAIEATDPHYRRELEHRMIYGDGESGYLAVHFFIVKDEQGRTVKTYGFNQDITERRRIEESLRREQALLTDLLDTIPDRIYFKDRQSRFVRINNRMAEVAGLPDAAAAVGKTDFDLFGEEHARQAFNDEQKIMETGEPMVDYEEKENWQDGRVGWVSSTKFPLRDAQGKVTGLVGISRDITARKHLEAQYRQAQKMEAFGQLAGGVAHDFNNILSVIMMQVNLLQMEQLLPGRVVSGLGELERCAMRGAGLTRQLLMFARRQEMETRQLNLATLVDEASKMLRRVLGEHIAFEFVRPEGEVWIEGDPGMIEQVLMNLCINARDAMREGGRLTIALRLDRRTAPGGDVAVPVACLAVADTGCGMDAATKARIFEPFFTTKPAGAGTGLGLATVYGIVQQHHGWVEVDSAPEQGSTFRVYFPQVAGAHPTGPVEPGIRRAPRGSEPVLLVEDEESLRSSLAGMLRAAGYRVVAAANGPDALRHWDEAGGGFALVITDYLMPGGLNGAQLAARLREARPALRVIIMSGYVPGQRETRTPWPERAIRLTKPFEAAKLLATIRECLDQPAPG